jgi:hypothetical protein
MINIQKIQCSIILMLVFCTTMLAQNDIKTSQLNTQDSVINTPMLQFYRAQIQQTLAADVPILTAEKEKLSTQQLDIQRIVQADATFLQYTKSNENNAAFRNEIFGIYAARPSDYNVQLTPECADGSCYRVEMYNFALNMSTLALVHLNSKKVLKVMHLAATQADIPSSLKAIALNIATESKLVADALGYKPTINDALMPDTKTALNRTRCERSKHLCVAPTFVKGDKALWAIVDLTDLKLVGIRWTNVGTPQQTPTQRRVQNENITECFCKKINNLDRQDWKMNYVLTSSDGLRISEVEYKGKRIINNAKLVDWHVSYSNTDGFGYSDAVGCPTFSTAAVVAVEAPKVKEIIENSVVIGFSLEQSYYSEGWPTACNYNYLQRYEFYNDGRFRVAAASLGRGCGNNGTYRPVTRIAFTGKQHFKEWSGQNWTTWNKESWRAPSATTPLDPKGFQYQLIDNQGIGYAMQANIGQLNDGGRGDNAFVYVTRNKPETDEGESDLMTIGPCCNTDYHQGPEQFMEPLAENIDNEDLVLWYVAQLKNDDRKGKEYCWAESFLEKGTFQTKVYPCLSGAMFVPIK